MKNIVSEILTLTEKSILTPYKVLENIHLEEYSQVNFSKKDGNIECTLVDSADENIKYLYVFDMKNKLLKAEIQTLEDTIELFNRKKELEVLLNHYNLDKKNIAQ